MSLRCGPWARHINPSLVLVQPMKTRPFILDCWWDVKNQIKQTWLNKPLLQLWEITLSTQTLHTAILIHESLAPRRRVHAGPWSWGAVWRLMTIATTHRRRTSCKEKIKMTMTEAQPANSIDSLSTRQRMPFRPEFFLLVDLRLTVIFWKVGKK